MEHIARKIISSITYQNSKKSFKYTAKKFSKTLHAVHPMRKMAERKCGVVKWSSRDASLKPNAYFNFKRVLVK